MRGGPYNKKSPSLAAAGRSTAEKSNRMRRALPSTKSRAKELLGLKEELKQCKLQLIEQKQNQASLIAAAKIEATSGHAAALLAQYKAGVKDGATDCFWEGLGS